MYTYACRYRKKKNQVAQTWFYIDESQPESSAFSTSPPPCQSRSNSGEKRGKILNYEIANVATWGHGAWEQFITVIPTSSPPWQVKNLPLIRHGEEAAMPARVRPAKRLLACSNDGKRPIITRLNHSWQSIFLSVSLAAKKKKKKYRTATLGIIRQCIFLKSLQCILKVKCDMTRNCWYNEFVSEQNSIALAVLR